MRTDAGGVWDNAQAINIAAGATQTRQGVGQIRIALGPSCSQLRGRISVTEFTPNGVAVAADSTTFKVRAVDDGTKDVFAYVNGVLADIGFSWALERLDAT